MQVIFDEVLSIMSNYIEVILIGSKKFSAGISCSLSPGAECLKDLGIGPSGLGKERLTSEGYLIKKESI